MINWIKDLLNLFKQPPVQAWPFPTPEAVERAKKCTEECKKKTVKKATTRKPAVKKPAVKKAASKKSKK